MIQYMNKIVSGATLLLLAAGVASAEDAMDAPVQHFIHKFDGEAKYPADVQSYPYLNPNAPIYGEYVSAVVGG